VFELVLTALWGCPVSILTQNKRALKKSALFADRTGLEPATSAVTGQHSNQLNYRSLVTF
jgi:hypothetical protein